MERGIIDVAAFDAEMAMGGYGQVETKERPAGDVTPDHAHGFSVRALVLDGAITLTWNGAFKTFSAGEVFTMEANCRHAENIGPNGVRYRVGRR